MSDIHMAQQIDALQKRIADLERREKPLIHQGARIYNASSQGITSGLTTTITLGNTRYDDGFRLSSTQLRVPYACSALVTATLGFSFNATGGRQVWIELNGTTRIAECQLGANASTDHYVTLCADWRFNALDTISLRVLQNSGAMLTVFATPARSAELAIHLW